MQGKVSELGCREPWPLSLDGVDICAPACAADGTNFKPSLTSQASLVLAHCRAN